jgi:hypothetical protein
MPKVAEQGLQAKLQKLSGSQPSIESVTEYCLFYYEDAQRVVAIWQQELQKARPERKLALIWVANHILLTAHRAKGQAAAQAYQAAFSSAMPKAVTHCLQQTDEKLLKGVTRTVNVWEERKVFSSKHIKQLKDIVTAGPAAAAAGGRSQPSSSSRGANGAAPSSSAGAAQLQQLGPVGEWLTSVHRSTQTTAEEQQKFSRSFTPVSATPVLNQGMAVGRRRCCGGGGGVCGAVVVCAAVLYTSEGEGKEGPGSRLFSKRGFQKTQPATHCLHDHQGISSLTLTPLPPPATKGLVVELSQPAGEGEPCM